MVRSSISPCGTRVFATRLAKTPLFARLFGMTALDDGTYDVLVIDARESDDELWQLELAVVSGAHKGAVVHLSGPRRDREATSVLGLPATLRVDGASLRLSFDG